MVLSKSSLTCKKNFQHTSMLLAKNVIYLTLLFAQVAININIFTLIATTFWAF